jgi:hypothetical protein
MQADNKWDACSKVSCILQTVITSTRRSSIISLWWKMPVAYPASKKKRPSYEICDLAYCHCHCAEKIMFPPSELYRRPWNLASSQVSTWQKNDHKSYPVGLKKVFHIFQSQYIQYIMSVWGVESRRRLAELQALRAGLCRKTSLPRPNRCSFETIWANASLCLHMFAPKHRQFAWWVWIAGCIRTS